MSNKLFDFIYSYPYGTSPTPRDCFEAFTTDELACLMVFHGISSIFSPEPTLGEAIITHCSSKKMTNSDAFALPFSDISDSAWRQAFAHVSSTLQLFITKSKASKIFVMLLRKDLLLPFPDISIDELIRYIESRVEELTRQELILRGTGKSQHTGGGDDVDVGVSSLLLLPSLLLLCDSVGNSGAKRDKKGNKRKELKEPNVPSKSASKSFSPEVIDFWHQYVQMQEKTYTIRSQLFAQAIEAVQPTMEKLLNNKKGFQFEERQITSSSSLSSTPPFSLSTEHLASFSGLSQSSPDFQLLPLADLASTPNSNLNSGRQIPSLSSQLQSQLPQLSQSHSPVS